MGRWLPARLGRIHYRLLAVNLFVLLIPVAGLEFARLHERQLLDALEREMRSQAVLARALLERDLAADVPLADPRHESMLRGAARRTRLRVRVFDHSRQVVVDSHRTGPPEGPESAPPSLLPLADDLRTAGAVFASRRDRRPEPPLGERAEVRAAFAGRPSAHTRVGPEAVYLFVSEPIRAPRPGATTTDAAAASSVEDDPPDGAGQITGVVYVTRSTRPVLAELYRIRNGLLQVLAVGLVMTLGLTLVLAWSIARPLSRLARAARRIALGEKNVTLPIPAGGELQELGEAFDHMRHQLDRRARQTADFAADVAHEFKSPLTSIRGAAELLEAGAHNDPEARKRFLHNIELDAQRLDRLVSRLLELGRLEASEEVETTFDLFAMARSLADRCASPEVPIQVVATEPRTLVHARAAALETALANLLDNAVRYSPQDADERAVQVHITCEGRDVIIDVCDRGPGVPEHQRTRIFDRFFTTDEARDGTGLGLAIVAAVATAHGGSITLLPDRPETTGARFRLRAPIRSQTG